MKKALFLFLSIALISCWPLLAQDGFLDQSFEGVEKINMKTVSGNCTITRGSGSAVLVSVEYTYNDLNFEPRLSQSGSELFIEERFLGNNTRGESLWNLQVPDGLEIDFSTASGSLEVTGLDLHLKATTASGNLHLTDLTGQLKSTSASGDLVLDHIIGPLKATTASGNIELSNSEGAFQVTSASGDIRAHSVLLVEESSFSAASGDVDLVLGNSPEHSLKVATASGDVALSFGGNAPQGRIVIQSRRNTDIQSDFALDSVEDREGSKWGQDMVVRTADFGGPAQIEIGTASGSIQVRQD